MGAEEENIGETCCGDCANCEAQMDEATAEQLRKQTVATKKNISKALEGDKNPAYKDGRRSYRDIAGAKKGEGVHHVNGDSKDNRPSNLEPYKLKGPERSQHESEHKRNLNTQSSHGRRTPPRGYTAKRLVGKR
jgi:hypothetical protein